VLLAQHRFTEARDEAAALVAREPDIPQYRSLLGEVAMEVGDYATTQTMFDSAWSERASLGTAPRLARWMELTGHIRDARRMLTAARDDAMSRRDVANETKAWFNLRVADLELRAGRFNAAESALQAGLAIEPDDPRLFAAMARLAAARGAPRDVIRWGERAIGLQLDPATLGLVGDAYAALGDTAKSTEYFHTLEVAVSAQPGAYHRAWSLYLLDHSLRVDEVLRKAQEELVDRKDIYGYDLVAWALHKSGREQEAATMMRQALKLNTPDPLLVRHAAAISKASGSVITVVNASTEDER
jgi:tetratricopeptide (TPR) repeat protein